jgi:hypothetical protein
MTKLRQLSLAEKTKAAAISAEGGMPAQDIEYFMRLPESLAAWHKGSLVQVLRKHSEPQFGALIEIIDALISRVKGLEKKLGITQKELAATEHKGVWEGKREYQKNNFVTHKGSMWVAKKDTLDEPGTSFEWQMVVRRGRPGRIPKSYGVTT